MSKTTKQIFLSLILVTIIACGTGIGNGILGRDPSVSNNIPQGANSIDIPISDAEFQVPIDDYNASAFADCGSFTEDNTETEIEAGRDCIRNADETCTPSKYLYNKTNSDESRFVSFVKVSTNFVDPEECLVSVHTVSDVPPNYFDEEDTCEEFTEGVVPEAACGILD